MLYKCYKNYLSVLQKKYQEVFGGFCSLKVHSVIREDEMHYLGIQLYTLFREYSDTYRIVGFTNKNRQLHRSEAKYLWIIIYHANISYK